MDNVIVASVYSEYSIRSGIINFAKEIKPLNIHLIKFLEEGKQCYDTDVPQKKRNCI